MATKPRGRPAFAFGTADFLVRHMNLRGPLSTALAYALKGYTVFSVFFFFTTKWDFEMKTSWIKEVC